MSSAMMKRMLGFLVVFCDCAFVVPAASKLKMKSATRASWHVLFPDSCPAPFNPCVYGPPMTDGNNRPLGTFFCVCYLSAREKTMELSPATGKVESASF